MRKIDADVLKEHIDKLPALPDGNFAGNHSALKALINMQPTIELSTNYSGSPNGWIPCDERLPEPNEVVLISVNGNVDADWIAVDNTGYGCWYRTMKDAIDIDAWMPLPEPYQEVEE